MKVNVYAATRQELPWLFDDFLRHFDRQLVIWDGRKIGEAVSSNEPLRDADAWIALRTDEAILSPNPARTVAQVHDMWPHDFPSRIGAIVRTHPEQRGAAPGFCRPIGSLKIFTPRQRLSPRFTVGWVGRPRGGKSPRDPCMLLDAVESLPDEIRRDMTVLLVGSLLGPYEVRFRRLGVEVEYHDRADTPIEKYPALYHRMDCLVITSTEEAGPMCLFEAISSAVRVLSTPVGWARAPFGWARLWCQPAERPSDPLGPAPVVIYRDKDGLAYWMAKTYEQREELFRHRLLALQHHRDLYGEPRLEDWVAENLTLAAGLAIAQGDDF